MKRIKRFSCAMAALAILLVQSNSALAKLGGTVHSDEPWTLVINSGVHTAVSVTFVGNKGKQDIDLFDLPPGQNYAYSQTRIPRGTRRIIIDLDYEGSAAPGFLTIQQGTTLFEVDSCSGQSDCATANARIVLEVVSSQEQAAQ